MPESGSGKVNVGHETGLSRLRHESDEGRAFGQPRPSSEDQNHAVMRHGFREQKKILSVARDQHEPGAGGVGEDVTVGAVAGQDFPQARHGVAEALERKPEFVRDVVIEEKIYRP